MFLPLGHLAFPSSSVSLLVTLPVPGCLLVSSALCVCPVVASLLLFLAQLFSPLVAFCLPFCWRISVFFLFARVPLTCFTLPCVAPFPGLLVLRLFIFFRLSSDRHGSFHLCFPLHCCLLSSSLSPEQQGHCRFGLLAAGPPSPRTLRSSSPSALLLPDSGFSLSLSLSLFLSLSLSLSPLVFSLLHSVLLPLSWCALRSPSSLQVMGDRAHFLSRPTISHRFTRLSASPSPPLLSSPSSCRATVACDQPVQCFSPTALTSVSFFSVSSDGRLGSPFEPAHNFFSFDVSYGFPLLLSLPLSIPLPARATVACSWPAPPSVVLLFRRGVPPPLPSLRF